MFIQEHSLIEVSFSKFVALRPAYIKINAKLPHNVCICVQHFKFQKLFEVLKQASNEDIPTSARQLLRMLVCNVDDSSCMLNDECKCSQIAFKKIDRLIPEEQIFNVVKPFELWTKSAEKVSIDSWTYDEVLHETKNTLSSFKRHCFVKWCQEKHFENSKATVSGEKVVCQVDFAMNYAIHEQDEIQQFHFTSSK